jgi:hypothetical protein
MLLQMGSQPGLGLADPADPTLVQDVFFRIGGAAPGQATTSLVVSSSQVILDDIWGIDHVVNGTGRSSTAANPDAPVDVVRQRRKARAALVWSREARPHQPADRG